MTCTCVRCDDCDGSGTLWRPFRSNEAHRHRTDDLDEPESCPGCEGTGIAETCDACVDARAFDE